MRRREKIETEEEDTEDLKREEKKREGKGKRREHRPSGGMLRRSGPDEITRGEV